MDTVLRIGRAAAVVMVVTVVACLGGEARPVAALPDDPWPYQWPVDSAVADWFRPPATPWGRGNRGLEFATVPGEPVRSAGSGRVVFAGRIGLSWYVTVAHPDRLRVSYSHLEGLQVIAGEMVAAGQVVGAAGPRLHVGVRAGEAYLDPAVVFGGRRRVHLIPTGDGSR